MERKLILACLKVYSFFVSFKLAQCLIGAQGFLITKKVSFNYYLFILCVKLINLPEAEW